MTQPTYNDIAEWYDHYLMSNPIYQQLLLPALFDLIGEIHGQTVCDLACGQGWLTRQLAQRGGQVTGVDLSEQLLTLARRYEAQEPLGISYQQGDVQDANLLAGQTFDGCVCNWSLVDIPDLAATFGTMWRLLKPGGWLIFSITHPCFEAPNAQWVTLDDGSTVRAITGYFREGFWKSVSGGVRSRVGAYHRMFSTYLNTMFAAGFVLERLLEPMAVPEHNQQLAHNQDVPSLMLVRAHRL